MAARDDELAALLALDALEPDEQADAELRLGTFPMGFAGSTLALAERVAAGSPDDLRAAALRRALARRPAGRPAEGTRPCLPLVGYERTMGDLYDLLRSLTDPEWEAVAHPEHGRVRDLIAHLVGVERLSARWLDPDEDVPPLVDHVASTLPVVHELADMPPHELAELWHAAASAVVGAARAGDPMRQVRFHDVTSDVDGLLIMRTFELWAHAMDISAATGRPLLRLDPERMSALSGRLMAGMPQVLAYRRNPARGTARFVLTGACGGTYTVPLHLGDEIGEPDFTLVADTVDLCRIAARRLRPDDLDATIEGDLDLARRVLADLDAFARD